MNAEKQIKIIGTVSISYAVILILGFFTLFLKFIPDYFFLLFKLNTYSVLVGFMPFLILIPAISLIVGGIGLFKYKNWARILLIIFSILNLFNFFIGTILGIWFLAVLFNPEIKNYLKTK